MKKEMKKETKIILFVVGIIIMSVAFIFGSENFKKIEVIDNQDVVDTLVETDLKNIYLFYGENCSYCHMLFDYLDSLPENVMKNYNVLKYETWYNPGNAELMSEFSNYLGDSASGVPYLVIGDKSFNGYTSNYDDVILEAILALDDDYVDVFEAIR